MFAEGNAVAARYVFRGTHLGPFGEIPATGRTLAVAGILVAHFRSGTRPGGGSSKHSRGGSPVTIYEAFSVFDSGDMLRQLDATETAPPANATAN
jgi:hypothetical protein